MESRLEKIFSMAINCMSLAVWLGEDRKCFAAIVGSDLASESNPNPLARVTLAQGLPYLLVNRAFVAASEQKVIKAIFKIQYFHQNLRHLTF